MKVWVKKRGFVLEGVSMSDSFIGVVYRRVLEKSFRSDGMMKLSSDFDIRSIKESIWVKNCSNDLI